MRKTQSSKIYVKSVNTYHTGAQINFPESGRGLGHVTTRIFGSTVGYPSDSLASCLHYVVYMCQKS